MGGGEAGPGIIEGDRVLKEIVKGNRGHGGRRRGGRRGCCRREEEEEEEGDGTTNLIWMMHR
jgi:hypothetical protein